MASITNGASTPSSGSDASFHSDDDVSVAHSRSGGESDGGEVNIDSLSSPQLRQSLEAVLEEVRPPHACAVRLCVRVW